MRNSGAVLKITNLKISDQPLTLISLIFSAYFCSATTKPKLVDQSFSWLRVSYDSSLILILI